MSLEDSLGKHLVTGVAGFVGRSIAAALLPHANVRGVDSFITGHRFNLGGLEPMEFLEGDLSDEEFCLRACSGIDTIFHEAALASVARSVKDPIETNRNCVDATLKLLNAARASGVRRFIYAGSSSAYGENSALPKREDMIPDPISPYAVAKLAGEHYVRSFASVYGMETVVLRYFNVFGPYQDPFSHYSGVLAIFCKQMLRGEQPVIYGDGEQTRDFTYIENVVHANLLASKADATRVAGSVLNIAAGNPISLNETVKMLRGMTGYQGSIRHEEARSGDIRHSYADIGLARATLGYEPLISFKEGLRRTVDWCRQDRSQS